MEQPSAATTLSAANGGGVSPRRFRSETPEYHQGSPVAVGDDRRGRVGKRGGQSHGPPGKAVLKKSLLNRLPTSIKKRFFALRQEIIDFLYDGKAVHEKDRSE